MGRIIRNVISVIYSLIKFSIFKLLYGKQFDFYIIERFSPNVCIHFDRRSKIVLGKKVRAHSGTRFSANNGGRIYLGDNCKFNRNCTVVSRKNIRIEPNVEFGPGVLIYDHDHDFRHNEGIKAKNYKCGDVIIGENSWIGANTIILRNTTIGKNCVIGAGSVVKGIVPDNTVLLQKRKNEYIEYVKDEK